MRIVTIRHGASDHPGVLVGDEVLDLRIAAGVIAAARLLPHDWLSILRAEDAGLDAVRRIIDDAGRSGIAEALRAHGALLPAAGIALRAPIPRPGLILSCGTNYRAHLAEFGASAPDRPSTFIKYSGAVIGSGEAILLPRSNPDLVDFEGELCVVIGKRCHMIDESEAMDHVLGYTLLNDVSARDWVSDLGAGVAAGSKTEAMQAAMSNALGKCFPTFAPLGPAITTIEELPDPTAIRFETFLDGELMQRGDSGDLIFPVAWLIARFSYQFEFQPGDILSTGSPPGVGYTRRPQRMLREGSVVEIRSDRIGTLRNTVRRA